MAVERLGPHRLRSNAMVPSPDSTMPDTPRRQSELSSSSRERNPLSLRRAEIIALARKTPGAVTQEKWHAVKHAVEHGQIEGPVPSPATLWRWLTAHGIAGTKAERKTVSSSPVAPSLLERRGENRARLDGVEERLRGLMLELSTQKHTTHQKAFSLMMKRIKTAREHHHYGPWLQELLEDCAFLDRNMAGDLAAAKVRTEADATETVPRASEIPLATATELRLDVVEVPASMDPHHLPAFRAPGIAEPSSSPVHIPPTPEYRQRVGTVVRGVVEADAPTKKGQVRALLLQPVLSGDLTPERAAVAWRYVLRHGDIDEDNSDTQCLVLTANRLPQEVRRKYQTLTERTLQRWVRRVREEWAECDAVEQPRTTASQVLVHRRQVVGRPRVATSDIQLLVLRLLQEQKNWNAARITAHLKTLLPRPVSQRTVQRIIAEHLSTAERVDARGGGARDDVFWRQRFTRDAVEPNHCWMMDHTWVRQEISTQALAAPCDDGVWEVEVRYQSANGEWQVRRGVHVTVVLDAHTRRVLAARVWLEAPDTRRSLLALRTAFAQFGAPHVLYTDNGSDLQSETIRQVLHAAGIHQVTSVPYTPQGRGRIERFFRTLKSKILPGMAGYYGGRHEQHWDLEELLTLEEFQQRLNDGIERLYNGCMHSVTRRCPTEHWKHEVGALGAKDVLIREVTEAGRLALLMTKPGVRLTQMGFRFLGGQYHIVGQHGVPNHASIVVHFDPDDLAIVFVSVQGMGNNLEYVGHAIRQDARHPAPDHAEAMRQQAEWRRQREAEVVARRANREFHAAQAEAIKAGLEIAEELSSLSPKSVGDAKRPLAHSALLADPRRLPRVQASHAEVEIPAEQLPWD